MPCIIPSFPRCLLTLENQRNLATISKSNTYAQTSIEKNKILLRKKQVSQSQQIPLTMGSFSKNNIIVAYENGSLCSIDTRARPFTVFSNNDLNENITAIAVNEPKKEVFIAM